MTFDKLTDNLELEAWTAGTIYVLKKVFLNEKAKKFYRGVWQTAQIAAFFLLVMITIFFVSRSKISDNAKIGISIALMAMMMILVYFSKKDILFKEKEIKN